MHPWTIGLLDYTLDYFLDHLRDLFYQKLMLREECDDVFFIYGGRGGCRGGPGMVEIVT